MPPLQTVRNFATARYLLNAAEKTVFGNLISSYKLTTSEKYFLAKKQHICFKMEHEKAL